MQHMFSIVVTMMQHVKSYKSLDPFHLLSMHVRLHGYTENCLRKYKLYRLLCEAAEERCSSMPAKHSHTGTGPHWAPELLQGRTGQDGQLIATSKEQTDKRLWLLSYVSLVSTEIQDFLKTSDLKGRNEATANNKATDVSKFLMYGAVGKTCPDWSA